jgi:hypothetical protein
MFRRSEKEETGLKQLAAYLRKYSSSLFKRLQLFIFGNILIQHYNLNFYLKIESNNPDNPENRS